MNNVRRSKQYQSDKDGNRKHRIDRNAIQREISRRIHEEEGIRVPCTSKGDLGPLPEASQDEHHIQLRGVQQQEELHQ